MDGFALGTRLAVGSSPGVRTLLQTPEPSTGWLVLLGVLALAVRARGARRAAG